MIEKESYKDFKSFKRLLFEEIMKYPNIYEKEYWVYDILTLPSSYDSCPYYCEFVPFAGTNDGETILKLSNFMLLDDKTSTIFPIL